MIDFSQIKTVFIDVDNCLTDGKYIISSKGEVSKSFYTKDFYAISRLLELNITVVICTQSSAGVINAQIERICNESNDWKKWRKNKKLLILTGVEYKILVLMKYYKKYVKNVRNYKVYEPECDYTTYIKNCVAYFGDAENDLECMKEVCYTGCPLDAIPEVKEESNYISEFSGGNGCVYDFCMHILKKRGK